MYFQPWSNTKLIWLQVESDCEKQDNSRTLSLSDEDRDWTVMAESSVQVSSFQLGFRTTTSDVRYESKFKNLNILANPATCITGALLQTHSSAKTVSWR